MGLLNFLGALSPVHINWVTLTSGAKLVGKDSCGNKYYQAKARPGYKRPRRWVMYEGAPEASKVPPEWHGWLHYQTDIIPGEETATYRREWQVPHRPNLTGTNRAYRPKGHVLEGGKRNATTGDYEPWTPQE